MVRHGCVGIVIQRPGMSQYRSPVINHIRILEVYSLGLSTRDNSSSTPGVGVVVKAIVTDDHIINV